jgi:hypothetical protein
MHKRKVYGIFGSAWAMAVTLAVSVSAAPPSGYLEANIGAPDVEGSTTVDAKGVWTVNGAGNKFDGSTEDQLYFVYKPIKGNGIVQARLLRESSPGEQYVGTMIRASLDPNAAFAGTIHSTSALNWIYRSAPDEEGIRVSGVSPEAYPKRMMVQRVGNIVTGFTSADGRLWQQITAPLELPLEETAFFGLAVSSRDPSTLTTTELDEVQVLEGVYPVAGVQSAATENMVLATWQPISTAVGYNVYRGPKDAATMDKLTLLNTTGPQTATFFFDNTASDTPLSNLTYVVAPVFKGADGKNFEGPAVRIR